MTERNTLDVAVDADSAPDANALLASLNADQILALANAAQKQQTQRESISRREALLGDNIIKLEESIKGLDKRTKPTKIPYLNHRGEPLFMTLRDEANRRMYQTKFGISDEEVSVLHAHADMLAEAVKEMQGARQDLKKKHRDALRAVSIPKDDSISQAVYDERRANAVADVEEIGRLFLAFGVQIGELKGAEYEVKNGKVVIPRGLV